MIQITPTKQHGEWTATAQRGGQFLCAATCQNKSYACQQAKAEAQRVLREAGLPAETAVVVEPVPAKPSRYVPRGRRGPMPLSNLLASLEGAATAARV